MKCKTYDNENDNKEYFYFLIKNYSFFFLIIFIISLLALHITFYNHQYFSVTIIILLGIFRYIILIFKEGNISISILYEIFLNIINSFCESLFYIFLKIFMENSYFSPYKICYIIGLINGFATLIIYFIFSYISYNQSNRMFSLLYNQRFYFDNIYSLFERYNFLELIGFFITNIDYPINIALFNIILQNFTICHIFMPFQLNDFFRNLETYTSNNIILFLMIIIGALELFVTLVFLEIIELNFCGLNKNIKKNIQIRALEDSNEQFNKEEDKKVIEFKDYFSRIDEETEE